jgi:hypothetical protein
MVELLQSDNVVETELYDKYINGTFSQRAVQ